MTSQHKIDIAQQIWIKAEKHRQASTLGIPVGSKNCELCPCCDQVIQKQPISLWEHTKQFQIYGFGYPLWFSFLKYCIILVLVLIASKTANQLYMAAHENYDFCYGNQQNSNQNASNSINQNSINQNSQNKIAQKNSSNNSNQTLQQIPKLSNLTNLAHLNILNANNAKESSPAQNPQLQNSPQIAQIVQNEHNNSFTAVGEVKCTSFMVFLSIFKGQRMYENYFLNIISFIIHLVALISIRNMILKQQQYYDERTTLISNYSIIIHNLPNVYGIKRKLQALFYQQFSMSYELSPESEIKEMIYVFKDPKIIELSQKKQQIQEKIFVLQGEDEGEDEEISQKQQSLQQQLKQVEQNIRKQTQRVRRQMDNDRVKCNKMIIVMATEGDKASVLYSFKEALQQKRSFNQYFYNVQDISDQIQHQQTEILIKQAPEPNEIIWQHIDQSDKQRKFLIIQGYFFTFLFLAIITIIFYFIMLAKTNLFDEALDMQEKDPTNQNAIHFKAFSTLIVFVALFGVILFNKFVMGKVLHIFVHLEHHAYHDKQNHSFALKYSLGMFFTTALMTLAVEALTFKNFYTHPYGVIEQETIMFFVTAFVIPLIWWIHPYNVCKNIRRKKHIGKHVSQKKANQLMQFYPYVLGKRYAQVFEIMWFTFLYSQLIPFGSFIILVGLILYYWVDKYNFLRTSADNTRVSGKMAILGLKSLDATLFIGPAGNLLFSWILRDTFDYLALFFSIIGIVYLFLPVTSLIWEFNGQKFLIEQKPYEESKKMFKETYWNMHPVYKFTHEQQNEQHRQNVKQFYKQEIKRIKLFGTGRGNYRRQSTVILQNAKVSTTSKNMVQSQLIKL